LISLYKAGFYMKEMYRNPSILTSDNYLYIIYNVNRRKMRMIKGRKEWPNTNH